MPPPLPPAPTAPATLPAPPPADRRPAAALVGAGVAAAAAMVAWTPARWIVGVLLAAAALQALTVVLAARAFAADPDAPARKKQDAPTETA